MISDTDHMIHSLGLLCTQGGNESMSPTTKAF